MSRASSSVAQRPLSTTEELEKLEQSITLTLQEIDRNFSRAHRIVTTNILPIVEQYGENCRAVWDASKFWKQFFEAAANVSLSGYEELANDEGTTTMTTADETTTTMTETQDDTTTTYTPRARGGDDGDVDVDDSEAYNSPRDDSLLSDGDGDLTGSTPRPPATKSIRPQFAEMHSPYEALRRELDRSGGSKGRTGTGARAGAGDVSTAMDEDGHHATTHDLDFDDSAADSELLAQRTARLPDMSMTPRPSLDERNRRALEDEQAMAQRRQDPLMHRVLDKNYRIQATPHKPMARGISPMRLRVTEQQRPAAAAAAAWQESSPMSSPEMAVPKLRSAAFLSPVRAAYRSKLTSAATGPRTPGVSVQTPATRKTRDLGFADISIDDDDDDDGGSDAGTAHKTATAIPYAGKKKKRDPDEITWESSDEEGDGLYGGISPPKTISFALPPSKLLQTPAREASKRIVEDILLTAGEDLTKSSEYSPTMVKMNANILDDTF